MNDNYMTNKQLGLKQKLAKLIQENPELPLKVCINNDIDAGNVMWYEGELNRVEIDEYICYGGFCFLKSEADAWDIFGDVSYSEAEVEKMFNNLGWEKVIVVDVCGIDIDYACGIDIDCVE